MFIFVNLAFSQCLCTTPCWKQESFWLGVSELLDGLPT